MAEDEEEFPNEKPLNLQVHADAFSRLNGWPRIIFDNQIAVCSDYS
jgi:hypothetical protein